MTENFIPYQSHIQIVNAARIVLSPFLTPFYKALRGGSLRKRCMGSPARIVLDTRKVIWYVKGTDIDIVYTQDGGYVLLDHIRKLRSPGLNNLGDALAARTKTLKELADVIPPVETAGLQTPV